MTHPRLLLRAEGAVLLLLSLGLYAVIDGGWLLFLALILVPDLSILGYLSGARVGAVVYNTVHALVLPALLVGAALLGAGPRFLDLALIWTAHIGADRMLGFGLKYPSAFRETHLQRV